MLIVSNLPIHDNYLHLGYVNRDFKGGKVGTFDPKYLKMEENFEKQNCTENAQRYAHNNLKHNSFVIRSLKKVNESAPKTIFFIYLEKGT